MKSKTPSNPELQFEAAQWVIRAYESGPDVPDAVRVERNALFGDWIARRSRLRAYLEMRKTYRRLKKRDPQRRITVQELLTEYLEVGNPIGDTDNNSPPLAAPAMGIRASFLRRWRSEGHRGVVRIAAPLGLCAALLAIPQLLMAPTCYATSTGEQRSITLSDGSTMHLGPQTIVAVLLTSRVREIRLIRGQALFDVKHNPATSFRTITESWALEDLGTRFEIYRRGARATISIYDGQVRLSPDSYSPTGRGEHTTPTGPHEQLRLSVILNRGQEADLTEDKREGLLIELRTLPPARLTQPPGWMQNRLSFSGETLAEAVFEFNRYNRQRLEIADPAIVNVRLLVGFDATNVDEFVSRIVDMYHLRTLPASADGSDGDVIRLAGPHFDESKWRR